MCPTEFERLVANIVECYQVNIEDAKKIAKIKDEDYQMEILEVMQSYNMDFKSAKRFLS
jgi:hypothetical protein